MGVLLMPVFSLACNFLFAWITRSMLDTVFPSLEYWDWFRIFLTGTIITYVSVGIWLLVSLFSD